MKDVRLFFEKRGALKFISHLDMNRFFTRIMRKSGLDVWYTEGFNPHPYITFALPLSLGFESSYEILDFRVNDDLGFEAIEEALKKVVPNDIKIIKADTPVLKTGKIAFTKYCLNFAKENEATAFIDFLNKDSIVISKRTKRGEVKLIDVKDKINNVMFCSPNTVELILPAGNDNINPSSLVATFISESNMQVTVSYLRTAILDEQLNLFI